MSRGFVLYDDTVARAAEPFALTRPFGELRAGALVIRKRWERLLGAKATGRIGAAYLASFDEFGAPRGVGGTLKAGTIVVNSRFAPRLDGAVEWLKPGEAIASEGGAVAAVAVAADTPVARLADGSETLDALVRRQSDTLPGWWIEHTWDLVRLLPEMLMADAGVLAGELPARQAKGLSVLGEFSAAIAPGAHVEPHVVFDTTAGDVVVLEGARIGAFARIAGPSVIGPHAQLAGGRYGTVSIGEHCRACGEMTVVIMTGHANKGHDGFVGHSVLGRWSNLGAGTTTSNLKNSYGKIRVQDSRGAYETRMQFLGSLIGDHAKTAIGTMLDTGTILGAGANVFGDRSPDKYVPPFAWGDRAPYVTYERDKFLGVAAHVMHRRDVEMTDGMRHALGAAWDATR